MEPIFLSSRFLSIRHFISYASFSRRFSISVCLRENQTKGKKKWTKDQLQPLMTWQKETESIYGPVIKDNKMKVGGKTTKTYAGNNSQAASDNQKSKQSSEVVEDHEVFIVKPPVFEDTADYEEVVEPVVSEVVGKKNSMELENSKVSASNSIHIKTEKESSFKNTLTTGMEKTNGDDVGDLKQIEKENGTRTYLSTILSYPPFTIAWDTNGGRMSIADAAKNVTDMNQTIKDSSYASVSTVLKVTMPPESKFFLDRWEKEMIEELGEEGFRKYKEELFSNGTNLHICIQKYLEGQTDIDLKEANQGHWNSLKSVFSDISDVICTEKSVKHPVLRYKGILDCVASYRGKKCVIDWKTSKKRKLDIRHTFDNPVQLAAYLGAYNSSPSLDAELDNCLLVIGYEDGTPATVHQIGRSDCLRYWQTWQRRLHLYWSDYLGINHMRSGH